MDVYTNNQAQFDIVIYSFANDVIVSDALRGLYCVPLETKYGDTCEQFILTFCSCSLICLPIMGFANSKQPGQGHQLITKQ